MDKEIIKPIIVEKDKKGNIVMTEEKLQEIIKEAFSNGYTYGQLSRKDGENHNLSPLQTPSPTIPTPDYSPIPVSPFWYDKFYCCVSKDVYATTEPKEVFNE